jgi:hypothetical protein
MYYSPNIIGVIKSMWVRQAGRMAHTGEKKNAHRVLVWKPEGKRPRERPRHRWEDSNQLIFKK